ncbi:Rrf2 family transcriptional regulator [Thiomicrospira microaerophila]|uniref:RrF2 family transcriptional regulator n=1 Tax=Thiomicrospira microaerophila TaxID=406020 RepID=UPI00201099EA|nr:Rrf2 family transcriptional regulator [Thiomicrospira microaerophila]UQB42231.1 Rrf2 family transcriptional regulator [Thiomicrospira microaerophila]
MQLTKQTDYAFRVLIFIASRPDDQRSTINEIAERFAISRSHLMKVVNKLVQHGFLASTRGVKGGLNLACPAEAMNVAEIVRLMESRLEPFECNHPPCVLHGGCALRSVFDQARDAFLQTLADYSLADIVNQQSRQRLFFGI